MRQYFEKQIEEGKVITEELLGDLKGTSLYGNYKVGDVILTFLEQKIGETPEGFNEPTLELYLRTIVINDLDEVEKDFKFLRIAAGCFPVLERI